MAITLALRWQILRRDNFACLLCGTTEVRLRVRFLVPIWAGGNEHSSNLASICDNCGGIEADLIPQEPVPSADGV